MANKYLNETGLSYFFKRLRTVFTSTVTYDSTNKKLVYWKRASANATADTSTDIVTLATLKTDMGLGNVANGAEVNQNAFSNVTVGSTTVSADTKTDTLTLVAGSNVTITPDATNDKITIAATDTATDVAYDSTNKKITKTINGTTSDVVTLATMKTAMALNNVNNTADANKSVASAAKATTLASYRLFDGISFNGSSDVVHFAIYDSTSPAISVDCANFQYQNGARIHIYHNQQISSGNNKTLNVENNGAVIIRYKNSPVIPTIPKGAIVEYIYYNDAFHIGGLDSDTTYSSMSQSEADGGSSTTGKLISASVLSTTIANAVAGVTQISYQIVTSLPATGAAGTIYLIKDNTKNAYKEYIWITDKYELLGDTEIEIDTITNAEIDSLFS